MIIFVFLDNDCIYWFCYIVIRFFVMLNKLAAKESQAN